MTLALALLPWVLVRLAYRALTASSGCFATVTGSEPVARISRALRVCAQRGWHREQLVFGAGTCQPGICVEQEYLKTLL
jgi:hypothetical protein